MPFLDVCHLLFKPAATIEDEASIFGKEWRMTLQYVLHQPGLKFLYTSRLSAEHDLWIFFCWENEDYRYQFYHQTIGFGHMSHYMMKAPSIFFFGNESYEELDEAKQWTIDVLGTETTNAQEQKHAQDLKHMGETQEQRCIKRLGVHGFVARQERRVFEKLYQGNEFDNAFIGLTKTDSHVEKTPRHTFKWEQYSIELEKCKPSQYPSSPHVKAPVDIAELTRKQPWEYGLLSYDESDYSETAYPMSLTFRPMSTLGVADEFPLKAGHQQVVETEVGDEHAVCIVSVSVDTNHSIHDGENSTENLRKKVGLQDGVEGLRELSVLRVTGSQDGIQSIRFLCVWNSTSCLEQWRQKFMTRDHTKLDVNPPNCNLDWSWNSNTGGLLQLRWEDMPLTPDKQSWQEVDKMLEIVEFAFAQNLLPAEKEAFEHRVYALTNTMTSCWSEDVDERPVVYAEDPVWIQPEVAPPYSLLLLAWDGTGQRTAWLRNFMANSFLLAGHTAHALGLICSRVQSRTYTMEKLYTCNKACDTPPGMEDGNYGDEESDRDMGF